MTWPALTKNNMLDGQSFTHMSCHTAYPGSTGANEVTGGSPAYARKSITMNASSGGVRSLNASVVADIPALTYVRFIGFWDSSTFVGYSANGGAYPKNFSCLESTDTIVSTNHGYSADQKIVFIWGTAPGGLTAGTVYYVTNQTADTFTLAATAGGATLPISSAASVGCWICAITEQYFPSQGTHTLSTASVVIPD
jgi:hypothetical protein